MAPHNPWVWYGTVTTWWSWAFEFVQIHWDSYNWAIFHMIVIVRFLVLHLFGGWWGVVVGYMWGGGIFFVQYSWWLLISSSTWRFSYEDPEQLWHRANVLQTRRRRVCLAVTTLWDRRAWCPTFPDTSGLSDCKNKNTIWFRKNFEIQERESVTNCCKARKCNATYVLNQHLAPSKRTLRIS